MAWALASRPGLTLLGLSECRDRDRAFFSRFLLLLRLRLGLGRRLLGLLLLRLRRGGVGEGDRYRESRWRLWRSLSRDLERECLLSFLSLHRGSR